MPTLTIPPQPPEYELPPEPVRPLLTSDQSVWDLWFAWANLKSAQVRRALDYQKEVLCVQGQFAMATAQEAHTAAVREALAAGQAPAPPWTEEQLVRQFMFGLAEAGVTGTAAFLRARASMNSFGDLYPPARPTQEGAPELPPLVPPPKPPTLVNELAPGPTGEQILPPAEKPQVPL